MIATSTRKSPSDRRTSTLPSGPSVPVVHQNAETVSNTGSCSVLPIWIVLPKVAISWNPVSNPFVVGLTRRWTRLNFQFARHPSGRCFSKMQELPQQGRTRSDVLVGFLLFHNTPAPNRANARTIPARISRMFITRSRFIIFASSNGAQSLYESKFGASASPARFHQFSLATAQ